MSDSRSPSSPQRKGQTQNYTDRQLLDFRIRAERDRKELSPTKQHQKAHSSPSSSVPQGAFVAREAYVEKLNSQSREAVPPFVPHIQQRQTEKEVSNFYTRRRPVEQFERKDPILHSQTTVKRPTDAQATGGSSAWRMMGGVSPAKEYQDMNRTATFANPQFPSREADKTGLLWEPQVRSPQAQTHLTKGPFSTYADTSVRVAGGLPYKNPR
jgi:hypothetical protein